MRCGTCVQVSYHETGPSRDDSNSLTTAATNATLEALLPGRNYTFTVRAVDELCGVVCEGMHA